MSANVCLYNCEWWHIVLALVVKYFRHWLQLRPRWWWLICRWLTTVPSFCPSFPHHKQKDSPTCLWRASQEWIPFSPISWMVLGRHHWEKLDSLWRTLCHAVSDLEVFLSSPYLLDLIDFIVHEAKRGGHLLKGVGELLGHRQGSASWNTLT